MIAGKGFLERKWRAGSERRRRLLSGGYAGQEAGLKRRSTISHPRVEPHDLASFGAASVESMPVKKLLGLFDSGMLQLLEFARCP